jgi:hypothetical protein
LDNILLEVLPAKAGLPFDTAMLISGDSDLTAPVHTIRRIFPAKRVVVAFPPGRHSVELSKAASISFCLGRGKIADSQLPVQVVKPDGYILQRPMRWR